MSSLPCRSGPTWNLYYTMINSIMYAVKTINRGVGLFRKVGVSDYIVNDAKDKSLVTSNCVDPTVSLPFPFSSPVCPCPIFHLKHFPLQLRLLRDLEERCDLPIGSGQKPVANQVVEVAYFWPVVLSLLVLSGYVCDLLHDGVTVTSCSPAP